MRGTGHYQIVESEHNSLLAKDLTRFFREQEVTALVGGYMMKERQNISSKTMQKEETVSVFALTFSSGGLIPATASLNREDSKGCLLDEDTMYQLFGTSRVQGQWLIYGEQEYQVRGLVLGKTAMLVVQNQDEDAMITSLVIDCKNELYRNQILQSELGGYCVEDNGYYTADYNTLFHWIETPNKWSDFTFFKNYKKRLKEREEHILYGNKDALENIYYWNLRERIKKELAVGVLGFLMVSLVIMWRRNLRYP